MAGIHETDGPFVILFAPGSCAIIGGDITRPIR